jgi:hypothetical protein
VCPYTVLVHLISSIGLEVSSTDGLNKVWLVLAEERSMSWSDRRCTGACQRMLSCVVSITPMEVLANGDAVG